MPKVLLVDGNPFLWRAAFSSPMDQVAQKVLTYFVQVMRKFSPDDVVVCWDKGKSRWRSEAFPEYKAHRLQQKKEIDMDGFEQQATFIRNFLDSLGIRQVRVEGVEADDILAWLAEYYIEVVGGWSVILTTGDRDLWQLVSEYLLVYDHQKESFADYNAVEAHFGVSPRLVPDLKSLEGDPSDNIPGVKGVGSKTAAALLREYGGIGDLLDPANVKALSKKKITSRVLSEGDFIAEMYRLVKIPRLREAVKYLTGRELDDLSEDLTRDLVRDPFKVQMLGEQVGVPFMDFKRSLPVASMDLQNFVWLIQSTYHLDSVEAETVQDLDHALGMCARCERRDYCKEHGPSYPVGHPSADIMLVGAFPGIDEYEARAILREDTQAGAVINSFLESIGSNWGECWATDVCKCYTTDRRPPTQGEILTCLPYLRKELDIIQPKLVISFGVEAMMALTPHTSRVSSHVGEILDKPTGLVGNVNAKVVISVNPVASLRSERCSSDLAYSATVIKKLLDEVTK